MTTEPGIFVQLGAGCFGLAVGFVAYRTLVRTTDKSAITDLAAVIAAVGGGTVTGLFDAGSVLFAWYSLGLLAGMVAYFVAYGILNGRQALGRVMSGRPVTLDGSAGEPDQPSGPRL